MGHAVQKRGRAEIVHRLDSLIARFERRVRRRLLTAINAIRSEITLSQLVTLLEGGRINEAIELTQRAIAVVVEEVEQGFLISAQAMASYTAGRIGTNAPFDMTDERAIAILRANRSRLVTEFTAQQRELLTDMLVRGRVEGQGIRETARLYRQSIGLTSHQERQVRSFRRSLELGERDALRRALRDRRFDRTVERAISGDRPLTKAQIDRMENRYRERFIRMRAETIARTETLRAIHEGAQESLRQSIASGLIEADAVVQTWITAADARRRDWHTTMHRQQRGFGELFVSGQGNTLRHPGDVRAAREEIINCRCSLATRINR